MSEKTTAMLLSKVLHDQNDGTGVNRQYIDILLHDDFPIICVNRKAQKKKLITFRILYEHNNKFWQRSESWEYYLAGKEQSKLKEISSDRQYKGGHSSQAGKKEKSKHAKDDDLEELEAVPGFGNEYKVFAEMPVAEKIKYLNTNKQRLNELISHKPKDVKVVAAALVDTTKDAALINHAALEEAIRLGDDEAKKLTQEIVDSTHEMVKSSAQLISENVFDNELIDDLVKKSNGTIVQHMTRVYLNGIAFLSYYNNLVSTSSAIQKLRITFSTKYRNYYHTLLPHVPMDSVVLERVFLGGMRAITSELYYKWAVGFLIHDIGKAAAVEYHEGEAKYNRDIVIEHVKLGYKSIMNKTNYPMEASLITGYHHEYYGDPDGYGYFRAYLQQYKKLNPDAKQDYVITYDLEPILDYKALAYFPAKVLEIVDIYDSVTDPHRAYRKAMTPDDALTMMRTEFVKKHLKIDPILFDIFDSFIHNKHKGK